MVFDTRKFAVVSYPQEVQIYSGAFRLDRRALNRYEITKKYTHCRVLFAADDGQIALELLDGACDDGTMVKEFEMKKSGASAEEIPTVRVKKFLVEIRYDPTKSIRARYAVEEAEGKKYIVFTLPRFEEIANAAVVNATTDVEAAAGESTKPTGKVPSGLADLRIEVDDVEAIEVEVDLYLSDPGIGAVTLKELTARLHRAGVDGIRHPQVKKIVDGMATVEKMQGGFYREKTVS